jgi:hypothetical protein
MSFLKKDGSIATEAEEIEQLEKIRDAREVDVASKEEELFAILDKERQIQYFEDMFREADEI